VLVAGSNDTSAWASQQLWELAWREPAAVHRVGPSELTTALKRCRCRWCGKRSGCTVRSRSRGVEIPRPRKLLRED